MCQMIELVRAGRTPEQLAKEFFLSFDPISLGPCREIGDAPFRPSSFHETTSFIHEKS